MDGMDVEKEEGHLLKRLLSSKQNLKGYTSVGHSPQGFLHQSPIRAPYGHTVLSDADLSIRSQGLYPSG